MKRESTIYIVKTGEATALKLTSNGSIQIDLIKADSPYSVPGENDGDRNLIRMFNGQFIFVDLTFNFEILDSDMSIEEVELEAEGFTTLFSDFLIIPKSDIS
jgi:hypothetical protein